MLLSYLDKSLSEAQLMSFKREVESSEALQVRLKELQLINETLAKGGSLMEPSSNFTQRVMARLDYRLSTYTISPRNGLLLLCGLLVATGISVAMLASGFFDHTSGTMALPQIDLPSMKEYQLPKIPLDGKLIVKIIIGINTVLAFILLDRTILRPYFSGKDRHAF